VDWIDLAQDRGRWQACVNMVMNHWVRWSLGNFVTTCGIASSSSRFCCMELVVRQKSGPVVWAVMWLVMCCRPWKPEKVISVFISKKSCNTLLAANFSLRNLRAVVFLTFVCTHLGRWVGHNLTVVSCVCHHARLCWCISALPGHYTMIAAGQNIF